MIPKMIARIAAMMPMPVIASTIPTIPRIIAASPSPFRGCCVDGPHGKGCAGPGGVYPEGCA
jgi:hypothetical protein